MSCKPPQILHYPAFDSLTSLPLDYQGRVECWDPRVRNRVGMLDCALSSLAEGAEYVPSCHTEMSNDFS